MNREEFIKSMQRQAAKHLCIGDSRPCGNSVSALDVDNERCTDHWKLMIAGIQDEIERLNGELRRRIGEIVE